MIASVTGYIVLFSLILAFIIFVVYSLPLVVKFAKGHDFTNGQERVNPFTNEQPLIIIVYPGTIIVIGLIISITWIVSIPALCIVIPLILIRHRNLKQKKVVKILKE